MKLIWSFVFLLSVCGALVASAQPVFSNAVALGTIDFGELRQASGIAASRNNPGVLWTHNDSGDGPRIFAIDTQGQQLGTYNLSGVSQVDYEDIAIGPGPVTNVSYLFLGDIGDNNAKRDSIVIYQIPEPAVYLRQAARPPTVNVTGFRSLALAYPDGAHNAEALMVDPISGDLFIGTKQTNVSRIYTATKTQLDGGSPITLSFVREIAFDLANGATISPDGREIIFRQEDFAKLWTRQIGQSVGDALTNPSVSIPVVGQPDEPNGEAIGFDPFGEGYYTVSDSATTQPLYYFARSGSHSLHPHRVLVDSGATWRYLDTGTNLGISWRSNSFNDATWKSGEAQFGYGDGDEQTIVSFGPNSNAKFITTYFRKSFVVTNQSNIGTAELKLLFDDGAAAFLNGTPVALANLTNGAAFNALASAAQEDLEGTWFTFSVPPGLLVEGTNMLAVEIHQVAPNNADLSFDAQLVATDAGPPQIVVKQRAAFGAITLSVLSTGNSAAIEASTNLAAWSVIGNASLTNGTGTFTDIAATNHSHRFYRALKIN